jgi:RNA polymerase sigma-70 factor (ECF subfamily)
MSSPEERFSALFERTHSALLGYAVRRVADPSDAADVVAETFLVAWRRLDDVPSGDKARPWLFGVARRVLANYYRGERRRHALADRLRDTLDPAVPAPEAVPSTVELAMERIPGDDRELLRLVAWEELAREEIALAMGLSRGAVRVRLHRARTRLRKAMEEVQLESGSLDVKRPAPTGHESGRWAFVPHGTQEMS